MTDLATLASAFARVRRAEADAWDEIAAEAAAERRGWIDQTASALGRRRHCAIVRRRVAAGDAAAAIVGRRFLLGQAAHDEELAGLATRPKAPEPEGTGARIKRRLGLIPGGKS